VEGRPLEESELIERAKRGDAAAYEVLVRTYQEIAYRTAYVLSGGASEAEDAAQEAFTKAWYALARFRHGAPFRPWLLQIVANEARNRRRGEGRRTALALRASEDRPAVDAAPSPEAAVLARERRRVLLEAIGHLRDQDRQVVQCRYLLELSEAETADTLGWPRGTVKSRLSRALARLRTELGSLEGAPVEATGGDARA
jgi:RNA polymerase sigma factor (sigma-70 family)